MVAVLPISAALSNSDNAATVHAEETPGDFPAENPEGTPAETSTETPTDEQPAEETPNPVEDIPQVIKDESGIPEDGFPEEATTGDTTPTDTTPQEEDTGSEDGGTGDGTEGTGDGTTGDTPQEGDTGEEQPEPEKVCICDDKCTQHSYNPDCEVCAEDHTKCAYKVPDVLITITSPPGWYSDKATVSVSVRDISDTGNFIIREVRTRIGTNGTWTEITDTMSVDISENCVIYVEVTDTKGKTYERNRAVVCFDRTNPTINASVSDGLLSIHAIDSHSGIKVIYVNGHEFTEGITNGTLNIRLQEFDSNYEYFTIQAMDNAGNMSEVYRTQNPYYKDPEKKDDGTTEKLPENATPTEPTTAQANVTEHVTTNGNGNAITPYPSSGSTSYYSGSSDSSSEDSDDEDSDSSSSSGTSYIENRERGKEFYTIQTESEKVFYLIVDRNGENETVYFLTEVSERDLLNVTETSETLPQNTAVPESAIPQPEGTVTITNNTPAETEEPAEEEPAEEEKPEEEEKEPEEEEEPEEKKKGGILSWIIIILLGAAAGGVYYFFKFKAGGPDGDYVEDEESEEDEYEDQTPVSESEEDERAQVPEDFANNFDTDDVTDTVE